jgi:hypothetical protein
MKAQEVRSWKAFNVRPLLDPVPENPGCLPCNNSIRGCGTRRRDDGRESGSVIIMIVLSADGDDSAVSADVNTLGIRAHRHSERSVGDVHQEWHEYRHGERLPLKEQW